MTLYITPNKWNFLIADFGVRPAKPDLRTQIGKFLLIKGSFDSITLIPKLQTSYVGPPLDHNATKPGMTSFSA